MRGFLETANNYESFDFVCIDGCIHIADSTHTLCSIHDIDRYTWLAIKTKNTKHIEQVVTCCICKKTASSAINIIKSHG